MKGNVCYGPAASWIAHRLHIMNYNSKYWYSLKVPHLVALGCKCQFALKAVVDIFFFECEYNIKYLTPYRDIAAASMYQQ